MGAASQATDFVSDNCSEKCGEYNIMSSSFFKSQVSSQSTNAGKILLRVLNDWMGRPHPDGTASS